METRCDRMHRLNQISREVYSALTIFSYFHGMKPTYLSRSSGSVHQLYIHLIFVTKYREATLSDNATSARIGDIFRSVCDELECKLLKYNSDINHVHCLVTFPPKVAIATLVNRLKGVSSYKIHRFEDATANADKKKRTSGAFWSSSYFVKTVAATSLAGTTEYIANQGKKRLGRE